MKTPVLVVLLLTSIFVYAGGPLAVTYTPVYPTDAKPVKWAHMPIHYRVDQGPFSSIYTNAQGVQRVQSAFNVWGSVSTASLSFVNDGALSTDVNTVAAFNTAMGSCYSGNLTPVIFDADGAIVDALGLDNSVIAFAGICKVDTSGSIVSGFAFLDGAWQDGVDTSTSPEISSAQLDEAVAHEFGHFLGLDHSQINTTVLDDNCQADILAGVPLMFPFLACPARSTFGLPMLAPDDVAWISELYPATSFGNVYGTISGHVYFQDGISQLQGINVIARAIEDPSTTQLESYRTAVSVVSGYLFTPNPGQSISAKYLPCNKSAPACPSSGFIGDNTAGGSSGSRNSTLIGYYEIPVPPGTYTIQVESIYAYFTGGSSVGPLDPPVNFPQSGYWSQRGFSSYDPDSITVSGGEKKQDIDLVVPTSTSRFDWMEGPGATLRPPDIGLGQPEEEVSSL